MRGPSCIAAPLMMSSLVMNNILRYEGKASFAMIGLVTGGVLNIVLDPRLHLRASSMGTGGAGIGHGPEPEHQLLHPALHVPAGQDGQPVPHHGGHPQRLGTSGSSSINGAPSFGRQGLNSIGSMLLNVAARNYGDAAVAGMSIVSRIFLFMLSVAIGVGQGLQPVAAFNYGARQATARVRQAAIFTIFDGVRALSAVLNVRLLVSTAEPLIRLFRDDPEVAGRGPARAAVPVSWPCSYSPSSWWPT